MGLYGSPELHPVVSPPTSGPPVPSLPSGAKLTPGETPVIGYSFRYSTVAFYLHTEVVLTDRRLYAARPNTLLGLIPVGTRRSAFPIENVASVGAVTRLSLFRLVLALIAFWIGTSGLNTPGQTTGGALWLVIAALLLLAVPKQAIEVLNSGGGAIRFPVSVFQRSRTVEFADRVSEAVARVTTRTTSPGEAPETIAPGLDLTDAMRQLSRLREQGLITEQEFAAKRAEIISRL
jgi:hypothetical protein